MPTQQYTISNGDISTTNAFAVPGDKPGGDDSFVVDSFQEERGNSYVHIDNGLDENVDVLLQGSHEFDDKIDSPADDGPTETVNSGDVGAFDSTVGHAYLQVEVTPAAVPSSGELVLTFQSRVQ